MASATRYFRQLSTATLCAQFSPVYCLTIAPQEIPWNDDAQCRHDDSWPVGYTTAAAAAAAAAATGADDDNAGQPALSAHHCRPQRAAQLQSATSSLTGRCRFPPPPPPSADNACTSRSIGRRAAAQGSMSRGMDGGARPATAIDNYSDSHWSTYADLTAMLRNKIWLQPGHSDLYVVRCCILAKLPISGQAYIQGQHFIVYTRIR